MRLYPPGLGPLLALALLLPSIARAEEALIDDDAIVSRVETEGAALVKAGKTVKVKALRAQLPNAHTCSLPLLAAEEGPLSPAEIYARRAKGVIVVGVLGHPKRKKKSSKLELAACSGFALTSDGIFVTNYHVVDNPEADTIVVMTRDGTITPASEVLAADKLADVVILRAPGAIFTPMPLAPEAPPVGSPVWCISHPDHNFFCLTSGIVSRYFMSTTEHGRTPQMAVTADFGSGSSGGPLLDARGQVTGMVCSTTSVYWEDEKGKETDLQMVFKHCVPVQSIRQLIHPDAQKVTSKQ
jgi:serine protease Do